MSARATEVVLAEDGTRLMTLSRVADLLGLSRSTVHSWAARRDATGFPMPAQTGVTVTGHDDADLYDLGAVRVWHVFEYDPNLRGVKLSARSADPARGGPAAVGRHLGVTTKRVCGWIERRADTHCPEPGEDGRYSLAQWEAWHEAWQQRPGVVRAQRRAGAAS